MGLLRAWMPNTRVSRKVIGAVSARLVAIGSTFLFLLALSRALPIDDAGNFFFLYASATLASSIARLGSDSYLLKELSGRGVPGNAVRVIVIEVVVGSILAAAALSTVISMMFPDLSSQLGLARIWVVSLALTGGNAMAVIGGSVWRATGRFSSGTILETALAPGLTAAIVYAAQLVSVELDLTGALYLYSLSSFLAGAIGVLAVCKIPTDRNGLPIARYSYFRGDRIRSQLHMMVAAVLFYGVTWSPVIVLGLASKPAMVAMYAAAARLANLINIIPAIQDSYIAPRIAKSFFQGGPQAASHITGRAANRALCAALPLGAALALASEPLLSLFGDEYADAETVLRMLVLAYVLVLLCGPVNPTMMTVGLEGTASRLNALLLGITVIAVAVLGSYFGAVGAAIGAGLGFVSYGLIGTVAIWKLVRVKTGVVNRYWVGDSRSSGVRERPS